MHDALVKPMPGNALAPRRAESCSMSQDGLTYEWESKSQWADRRVRLAAYPDIEDLKLKGK